MANDIVSLLRKNPYPGRGIVIGRSEDGRRGVALYFIMGRSENSRNRIFAKTPDGIRTEAPDPSKMTDPSLVIYHPVRRYDGYTIITNGDQTDTIRDFLKDGRGFKEALDTREFEPDPPIYTPRISGIINRNGSYSLSILKSADGDPALCCRFFFDYSTPVAGLGHFIHTYQKDGNPPPSFYGEPVPVQISLKDGLGGFADRVWDALNHDNRVALYACEIDIASGTANYKIINAYGGTTEGVTENDRTGA